MEIPRKSLILPTIALVLAGIAGAIWAVSRNAGPLMPHGHCFLWDPGLLWTHVTSDLLIGLAYLAISGTLVYLVVKARQDLPLNWIFIAFGVFIVACGGTHFVEVLTIWRPVYWFSAYVKIITAIASVTTAVVLPRRVPAILALLEARRNEQQQKLALEAEVKQRLAAEADLLKMKETLEQRVRDRTSELSQANSGLTLYETIFKSSAWGVAIVDSVRGLIQLANPAFARMHGYEIDEILGRPVSLTFAPESLADLPQVIDIVNARDHLMYESIHIRKDQTRFPCLTDVTLVRDPQGLPLYRFGYFQDISGQKRAEQDILSVVKSARCILWRAIVTGREGWERYEAGKSKLDWDLTVQDEVAAQHFQPLNIPPGKTYSQAWLASRHPGDVRTTEETATRAIIRGNGSYSQLFRCYDKFGELVWIREEVGVMKMASGRWECIGVCTDVTDEHRLNEQLRQQAELLELSHDAIIVRSEEGEIIYWNSGAEDLYGWHRDEVIGKNIHDLLSTHTPREEFEESLTKNGYWAGQLRHIAKGGREVVVDSRHLLVNRTDGAKVVLETNHDITTWLPADVVDACR